MSFYRLPDLLDNFFTSLGPNTGTAKLLDMVLTSLQVGTGSAESET